MTAADLSTSLGDPSRGKLSAEERLFQVIQNGGEPPIQEQGGSFQRFFRKLWLGLKRNKHHPDPQAASGSGLARLNKFLGVVIVAGLALSVSNLFLLKPDIKQVYSRVAGAHSSAEYIGFKLVPVEELLTPLTSRSFFHPKTEEVPAPADVPVLTSNLPVAGVLESLQLVGIAFGAQSEAMIREKKGGRTYFLKQGEQLNGVIVKEIQKDRVIVEYAGQTRELM